MLLGASHSWFPMTLSALSSPSTTDKLGQLIEMNWAELEECESAREVKLKRKLLKGLAPYSEDQIWQAVAKKKSASGIMFIVGLELDMSLIRGKGRTAAVTSVSSVVLPFSLGLLVSIVLHDAGTWFVTVDGVYSTFSTVYGVAGRATITWIDANHIHSTGVNTVGDLYRVR